MELPRVHLTVDGKAICGAVVPNEMALTTHLTGVTCQPCTARIRAMAPDFDGLPLDIELDATLRVSHSRLTLKAGTLEIEHRWLFSGPPRWRLQMEDATGAPFSTYTLAAEVGWRLPDILDDFLYHMNQARVYEAKVVYGRTRSGSAPRCAYVRSTDDESFVCKNFCREDDPRFKSDADHLAAEIQAYFLWQMQEVGVVKR